MFWFCPQKKFFHEKSVKTSPFLFKMTTKIRNECQEYKERAIEVEKKIFHRKMFEKCMEDLNRLQNHTRELVKTPNNPQFCTLENQLTFGTVSETFIPSNLREKLKKLTSETIDISTYSDEGVQVVETPAQKCEILTQPPKMIVGSSNNSPLNDISNQSSDLLNETKKKIESNTPNLSNTTNLNSETDTYPTPKLIRSNSYTLESPSPILLAHLEKEAKKCVQNMDDSSVSPVFSEENENSPKKYEIIDIDVQQVSVRAPWTLNSEIEPELLSYLKTLPPDSARSVLDILGGTKNYPENIYQNSQGGDFSSNSGVVEGENKPMSVSVCSTQSLYYSIGTPTPENTPEVPRLVNLRHENCQRRLFQNDAEKQVSYFSLFSVGMTNFLTALGRQYHSCLCKGLPDAPSHPDRKSSEFD